MGIATGHAEAAQGVDIPGYETAVGGPAAGGVVFGHFGQAEVAVDRIQPGQQGAVALGRGHGGIAALAEDQFGVGAGQVFGDDGLHPGPDAFVLFAGQGAQVAPGDGGRGHDIGLARGRDIEALGVDGGGRAPGDHPDIVGQVGLGKLAAETVEDAGQLIDRPIAERVVEHPAGVSCAARRGQGPVGRAAPGNGAEVRLILDRQILELQGEGGRAAGLDQVAACDRQRRADPLLVPGQEDGDIGVLQRAGRLHGAQGGDDDHHPALVIADAGPGCAHPRALEPLEGVVGLEDGVEVADQQDVPARPRMGGDQMAGAAGLRHVHPANRKAQRLQLGPDHVADDTDARQVQGATVLVHHPLQQGDVAVMFGGDRPDHRLFGGRRLRHGSTGQGQKQQGS